MGNNQIGKTGTAHTRTARTTCVHRTTDEIIVDLECRRRVEAASDVRGGVLVDDEWTAKRVFVDISNRLRIARLR